MGARTDTFQTSCSTLSEGHIFSKCKNIGINMFDKPLAKPVHSLPCDMMPTLPHSQPLCVSFLNATRTFFLLAPFYTLSWFHPREWYQKEVIFPGEPTVTWVLEEKLSEKLNQRNEESLAPHDPSATWAVFLCKRKGGQGEKHAMKFWIQYDTSLYPWTPRLTIQNPLDRYRVYIQRSP